MLKGVLLADGAGGELHSLTKITNKHLLPVYDRPMVYYPLQTLVEAGIRDNVIVVGGGNAGDSLRLLGNGKDFGLDHIDYIYQEDGGVAQALALVEHFANGCKLCVISGDNIIEGGIRKAVEEFGRQPTGARILLKEVQDTGRFGVPEIEGDRVVSVEEKPEQPKSKYAVTGVYMYDSGVFEEIRALTPGRAAHQGSVTSTTLISRKAG